MTTREQDLAIREGAFIASSRDYFGARSRDFDTERSRRVFESGFVRGYDAAAAPLLARIAELEAQQAAQPVRDSLHDDIQSVLFEVEQAIGNGACPWQIEAAFEAYEAARRLQLPDHGIPAPKPVPLTDAQKQRIANETGAGHSLICLVESYINSTTKKGTQWNNWR